MTRTIFIAAALALAAVLPAVPAQAQVNRTFVSAAGSDSNNCANVASPCRHFAAAFAATAVKGEIYVLDPANYGSLTITHSVSIQGHGWGSVAPTVGGTAITINAGPNDAVNLSGLTIDGAGIGAWGIVFNSGASLVIENCVARNLTSSGIGMGPSTSTRIAVSNTLVANNGVHGIYLQPSGSGTVYAVFNRVEAYSNGQEGIGIYSNNMTGGSLYAVAVDSVAAFNNDGFYALGSSAIPNLPTLLVVSRSTTVLNVRNGVRAEQNGYINVSQSNLETDFWAQAGGCVASYGDNVTQSNVAPCGTYGKD